VPRRATTRRPGRQFPVLPALVGLAVLIALGAAWTFDPFGSAARLSSITPGDASRAQVPLATPGMAQLADVALPTVVGHPIVEGTPLSLMRPWTSASVDGIVSDPVLVGRLDQALSGVDGHVGVVVKDLGSGRGAVLNGDLELQSASLYKLPVMFTVFDLGLNMSEELTITDEALSYDAGTMELSAGETLSVAEALERMITLSDNTSAILLGGRVGAARITTNLAGLGMDSTHYSLERMTTSALDISTLLELIADGKAVSPGASADMLHLLLRQRVNDRLPRLLPASVQVAHKTGNLPGVVNDAGILYGRNSTVLVAALVSDTNDEAAAADAIAQVGLIASTYFETQGAPLDRPTVLPAPSRPIPPVVRESHPPTPTPTPAPPTEIALLQTTPTVVATAPPTAVPAPTQVVVAATLAATPVPTVKPTSAPPPPTATRVPPPATATTTPVPPPPPTKPPVKTTVPTVVTPGRR
jgi:beta-lactamase class A